MVYNDIKMPLPAFIALDWTLMSVALIPIILRLSLRWKNQHAHSIATNISDSFIVGAWLSGIVLIGINTWKNTLRERYLKSSRDDLYYGVPHDQAGHLLYVSWISLYFIYISLWMSKGAFLAFYYSLFSEQGRRTRWILYIASAFTASTFLLHMFLLTFWCNPIASNWNVDGKLCSAVHDIYSVTISTFTNVATDLVIISIPISTLMNMTFGKRELSGLIFVFLMGSVSIVAALARYVTLELVRKVPRASITHTIDVWALVEIVSSLLAVCLPSLRTFVRQHRPSGHHREQRSCSSASTRTLSPAKSRSSSQNSSRTNSAAIEFLRKESEAVSPSEAWFDDSRYLGRIVCQLDVEAGDIRPVEPTKPLPVAQPYQV